MATNIIRHGLSMRKSFDFTGLSVTQWFPGHMAKGLNQMQRKLKSVDCIIEVHDARIPISGRNPVFENRLTAIKPHLMIMNKMDLISYKQRMAIQTYYEDQGVNELMFTNCKKIDSRSIKSLIPTFTRLIQDSVRYNRSEERSYQLLIIGIPNVGKSSLINAVRAKFLRRGKASAVGGLPGVTRSVLERIKVCNDPAVYLLDTPGVLSPRIPDVETGLKLAIAATIKDHLVGEILMANYLLFKLNEIGNHSYVENFGLDSPSDNIQEVLTAGAIKNKWFRKAITNLGSQWIPDTTKAATNLLKQFRLGGFGKIILDELPHPSSSDVSQTQRIQTR